MQDRRVGELIASFHGLRRKVCEHAWKAKHAAVTPAHLAVQLVCEPDVEEAIEAAGLDVDEARYLILGTMDEQLARRWWQPLAASESQPLLNIYERAFSHSYSAELDRITPALLLVHMLTIEPTSQIADRLDAIGLEPLPLRLFLAHGHVKDEPLPKGQGPAVVVLHNDPFTTKQVVVDVLQRDFRLSEDRAHRLMRRVHEEGRGVLRLPDWRVARERAETARRHARELGFPLTFTLEV